MNTPEQRPKPLDFSETSDSELATMRRRTARNFIAYRAIETLVKFPMLNGIAVVAADTARNNLHMSETEGWVATGAAIAVFGISKAIKGVANRYTDIMENHGLQIGQELRNRSLQ